MRNFTKRQKRALRAFAAGMSCCMTLAIILVAVTVMNTTDAVPVKFSDILDGAAVTETRAANELPIETMQPERLYETLYPTELLLFTTPISTTTTPEAEPHGAGGTILLETTPQTTQTSPETTTAETTTASSKSSTTSRTSKISETSKTSKTSETSRTSKTSKTSKATVSTTKTEPPVLTTIATRATTTTTTTAQTSKTPFTNIGGGTVSDDDSVYIKMLNLVNNARKENGLSELWYSARVHEVSTLRAYELCSYYSHTRPNGTGFSTAFSELGISYRMAGENIAYGRNMFETPEEVFEAWMDSPSHRENILNPNYECVAFGLCTLKVGNDTYYYWSQEFALFF